MKTHTYAVGWLGLLAAIGSVLESPELNRAIGAHQWSSVIGYGITVLGTVLAYLGRPANV